MAFTSLSMLKTLLRNNIQVSKNKIEINIVKFTGYLNKVPYIIIYYSSCVLTLDFQH